MKENRPMNLVEKMFRCHGCECIGWFYKCKA